MRTKRIGEVAIAATCLALASAAQGGGCVGDVNEDGTTGFGDLVELLASWGPCDGCPSDLDGNGTVSFEDLLTLLADWGCTDGATVAQTQLVGRGLPEFPWFTATRAFNEGGTVQVAVDPFAHPDLIGIPIDLYVVEPRTAAEWDGDGTLGDVRGSAQSVTFNGPGLADAIVEVTGGLSGDGGVDFGVGYDLVLDVDGNGALSTGDLIDGYGDEPGFFVVNDTSELGPLAWNTTIYSGGSFLGQILTWPQDIASLGPLPLVVISHGNGHQYNWYSYMHQHFASHGYIVMSHQNETQPGIDAASLTTLDNTDYLLGNLDTIAGGVLDGHVDTSRIIWVGHSRGGEGIVRAYDRMRDGTYTPDNFTRHDIVLMSSIAPTDFLGVSGASPGAVWYHLIYGSADGDVHGGADCDICQSFHLYERATASRASTYVQGADHNDFNCCGFNDYCLFGGNCSSGLAVGRPEAQDIALTTWFALFEYVLEGNPAAKDFLWRQVEDLRPLGWENDSVVDREFRDGPAAGNGVIDDYQTETSTGTSSSGGAVTFDVSNVAENRLNDTNTTFTWLASDPMNGMTRGRSNDATRGCVFDWSGDSFMEFEVVPSLSDWSDRATVSFRVCQGTRHPNTTALVGDLDFAVTLRDGTGTTSTINFGTYSGGAEEPFVRTGQGSGSGWANEFETIRIPLADFLVEGSGLDLGDIVALRFDFGPSFGSSTGRVGLDDVELTND